MSFKDQSISVKIISTLVLSALFSLFAAFYSGNKMQSIDDAYSRLIDHDGKANIAIARANRAIVQLKAGILENIISVDEAGNRLAVEHQKTALDRAQKRFSESEVLVPAFAADLKARSESLGRIYEETCRETVRLANEATDPEGNAKAANLFLKDCQPQLDQLEAKTQELVNQMIEHTDKSSDELSSVSAETIRTNYIVAVGGLVIVAALSIFIALKFISAPIRALVGTMSSIAEGNLSVEVPFRDRKDEVGLVAGTLVTFRDSLVVAEQARQDLAVSQQAEHAIVERRSVLAETFVSRMQALAGNFTQSSGQVSDSARNLSATAEETSRQAQAVSAAAEEASANVRTVAAATEEMAASVREISSQVLKSNDVANAAASEAARTETDVRALADAASKIGEVVDLISNIAAQTNLLALNATIEAARAGDAGRGFAVVASEVKQLASQTAKATGEISGKINEIQQATNRTVSSINGIVGTISQIQGISTIIATAIEQQGAATNEISGNTQQAAQSTEDVTSNINGVGRAADMTGAASAQLMSLSSDLNDQAGDLQKEVVDFVKQLRAA